MKISDDKTVREIQKEFQSLFPYLKLEFYKEKHDESEGSPDAEIIDSTERIGDISNKHAEGDLLVDTSLTVAQLESAFADNYGLFVQVFRKSTHDIWLQTISTDDWTLEEQNQRAEEFIKGSVGGMTSEGPESV